MSNELTQWLSFFFEFIYNFMYSVKVPGINIPVIYFFIISSVLFLLFGIFRRMLFSPNRSRRNVKVKGGNNADS